MSDNIFPSAHDNSANPYSDIIDSPRHISSTRPHMAVEDRAAQFAPFAALVGYDDAVEQAAVEAFNKVIAENTNDTFEDSI